jgi:hypothetical protein
MIPPSGGSGLGLTFWRGIRCARLLRSAADWLRALTLTMLSLLRSMWLGMEETSATSLTTATYREFATLITLLRRLEGGRGGRFRRAAGMRPRRKRACVAAAKDFPSFFAVFVALALILGSTGCVRRAYVAQFDGTLDVSCITKPVRLIGCDFSKQTPSCKRFEIAYRQGCEQIDAKSHGR